MFRTSSNLAHLLSVLTYVLKFCSILQKTITAAFKDIEGKNARLLLIRSAQVHVTLKSHRNFAVWERQLSLFTNISGILRCQGRIGNVLNLSYSTKYPVTFSVTTISQLSRSFTRQGTRTSQWSQRDLTKLRPRFWVYSTCNSA